MRTYHLIGACLVLLFLSSCRPSSICLSPLPSQIERIEGYASLRITEDQGSARSKFSFLFQLPNQGRIEVANFLGTTLYQIIIDEGEAFLLVPSKKVYWHGEEDEIIGKFLGFRLNLHEMISLLSGQWRGEKNQVGTRNWRGDWTLEKDEKGRIEYGRRGELWFEIKEFFNSTTFARLIIFEHPLNKGRLRILNIGLNRPLKKEGFSKAFLENYEQKTWLEIQEMLDNAN